MLKNCIIIFQFFLLCSLLIQKPENAELLIKDLATSKEMVVSGADYLHETFDREFEVHTDEEFQKEHGEERNEGSDNKTSFNSFQQNKGTPSNVFIKEQTIIEDTWFNEK